MDVVLIIANVALVLVTGAYVWLTRRMASASEAAANAAQESAGAARDSAEAAKQAAQANKDSAVAAMASLRISFSVDAEYYDDGSGDQLLHHVTLTNTGGASVVVHDLRLDPVLIGIYDFEEERLHINMNLKGRIARTGLLYDGRSYFLHQGQGSSLELDPISLDKEQSCEGYAVIEYSVDGERESSRNYYAPFKFV